MTDSLTDTSLLDKASDMFADGINSTMDAIFGDSRSPNDYPGGKITQDAIGWRVKKAAAEAIKNDPNLSSFVGASPLLITRGQTFEEWPSGLSIKGSENNGPYVEFRAFEYNKLSTYRRSGRTVGESATKVSPNFIIATGLNPADHATRLFHVRLPFRGNVRKNVHAETVAVDNWANQVAVAGQVLSQTSEDDMAATIKAATLMGVGGALAAGIGMRSPGALSIIKDQVSLTTGTAMHPAVETLYKNPTINEHTFEFTLIPRNAAEAQSIRTILELFQCYALPAEIPYTAGLLFDFPALFEIFFYAEPGKPIRGIRPIPDCMIQNIDVIYDPTGTGRLMTDNTPIAYRFSLNFIEQKVMTRSDFEALGPGVYAKGVYEDFEEPEVEQSRGAPSTRGGRRRPSGDIQ